MKEIAEVSRSADWSVQYIQGELADMTVAMKLLDHLHGLGRHADTAKIFQGSQNGSPCVYVVTRWQT